MSDGPSLPSMPSDVAGCQALIKELQRKVKSQVATIESHSTIVSSALGNDLDVWSHVKDVLDQ